jgi:hypothetical protein
MARTVRCNRLAATAERDTVNDMPKMTDYVRQGFKRRPRPWSTTDLPEWWDTAVWIGVGGVIAVVLFTAVFDHSGDSTGSSARRPHYAVQAVNPYATPSASDSPAPSPGTTPSAFSSGDFTATAAVQVTLTGGGTAPVPAGARNVALAAAKATATGDWAGVPLLGKPKAAARTPGGTVIGDVTVSNPSATGAGSYLFSATISKHGTANPYLVQIAVERTASGYAVRPR